MDEHKLSIRTSSAVTPLTVVSTGTSTSGLDFRFKNSHQSAPLTESGNAIESAIYQHLQAMRALGRTSVTVPEIASALGLDAALVGRHMESLRDRGLIRR
jgi:DNA-binding MarR family transcriptional regulator